MPACALPACAADTAAAASAISSPGTRKSCSCDSNGCVPMLTPRTASPPPAKTSPNAPCSRVRGVDSSVPNTSAIPMLRRVVRTSPNSLVVSLSLRGTGDDSGPMGAVRLPDIAATGDEAQCRGARGGVSDPHEYTGTCSIPSAAAANCCQTSIMLDGHER